MRLFIAVAFDSLKDIFLEDIRCLREMSGLRASYPRSFHLTLKFLGEVKEEQLPMIIDCLSDVTMEPFSLEVASVGVFPETGKARVIWRGVSPKSAIISLQKKITNSLAPQFPDDKKFHPHITLARVKETGAENILSQLIKKRRQVSDSIRVDGYELIQSVLSEGPVEYKALRYFPISKALASPEG